MDVYFRLPIALQNAATWATAAKNRWERYGHPFGQILQGYRERASWSADRLASYRDDRLRCMVDHCYRTVPYYRQLFKEGGISPASIKTIDDLSMLPVLTKDDVRACPEDFLSSDFVKKRVIRRHTSGTTGSSFQFVMDRRALMEQWAVTWRYWEGLGISFDTPHAMFGTRRVASPSQTTPPFWRSKAPVYEWYFSAFHESDEHMAAYFDEIDRRGFSWIHGYPSLVTPLAAYMVRTGRRFARPLSHVTLAAENLLTHQRELMVEAFGVEPRMHYASTEGVANASQGAHGIAYRIDEDYAVTELLPLDDFSDAGEIVGTSLTNYAMPLLRWRLRDLGREGRDEKGHRVLLSIDGRTEDYLKLPSGVKIGKLDHVFKDTKHFREAQIRQASDYSVELWVVATQADTAQDEAVALRELRESGCDVPVSFHYRDSIPKTKAGKLKFVISEVE
jgi:Coenzyme F390 synthetase